MLSTPFTVGIIQDSASLDAVATVAAAEERVREAARRGAQIICLKELFNAPYYCKSQKAERFDLAEPIPGPTTDRMQRVAKELGVVLIVPIFERQAAGVYRNSAVIIDADGAMLGIYRKMHIPDDPLFNEKYYFVPGDATTVDHGPRGTDPVYTEVAPFVLPGGVGPHKWTDRRLLDAITSAAGPHAVPLLLDDDGSVLESTRMNVLIEEGGRLVSPPADGRFRAGFGRTRLQYDEEPVDLDRLLAADAVVLTSALRVVRLPQ